MNVIFTSRCRGANVEPAAPSIVGQNLDAPEFVEHQALLCKTCAQPVTTNRERIRLNGQHLYTVFNPQGILFEVGCFACAPGCRFDGEPTHDFSWFPGYAWRFAFCCQCCVHLGWEYRSEADSFVGLIMTELRET